MLKAAIIRVHLVGFCLVTQVLTRPSVYNKRRSALWLEYLRSLGGGTARHSVDQYARSPGSVCESFDIFRKGRHCYAGRATRQALPRFLVINIIHTEAHTRKSIATLENKVIILSGTDCATQNDNCHSLEL